MSNKAYHILHCEDGFVKRWVNCITFQQLTNQKYIMYENALATNINIQCSESTYSPDCTSPWFYAFRFPLWFSHFKNLRLCTTRYRHFKIFIQKHGLKPIWKVEFRYFQPVYWMLRMFNWKMGKTTSSVPSY